MGSHEPVVTRGDHAMREAVDFLDENHDFLKVDNSPAYLPIRERLGNIPDTMPDNGNIHMSMPEQ